MSLNWPKAHYGSSAEFQVSSWPFVTSSQIVTANDVKVIEFPGVTRWIVVHNGDHGGSKLVKFGFTENCFLASNSNFFDLHAGEKTERLELKCTKIYITATSNTTPFNVMAGYTNVPVSQFPVLTGSNGFVGVG